MVVYIIYIQKPMIENSNFYSGSKRVAGGGIAIALVKMNGLMRAAGKLLRVMAAGTGPLSNRVDMSVSEERAFWPIQVAPQRFLSLSCLIGDKGFFIFRR